MCMQGVKKFYLIPILVCVAVAYLFSTSVSILSSSLDEMKCHFSNIIQCFTHLSVGEEMLTE